MWGTSGLGVDYRDEPLASDNGAKDGTFKMVTALQTMQFGIPLAYTSKGYSMGFTPIVQYSSLDVNYNSSSSDGAGGKTGGKNGAGVAQDLAYGYTFGLDYKIKSFTVGAMYKSKIKFDIKDVLKEAMLGFGHPEYKQSEMATPSEYGLGVSYKFKEHTVAFDYKNIKWSDAEVYKDFEWEDQAVIALGYEYTTNAWAVRTGYQYAKSAVQNQTFTGKNSAGLSAGQVNTFNLLGFPGTQESHVTLGGSYMVNKTMSIDSAVVLGLESTEEYTNLARNQQKIETKHSEKSLSVQVNYAF
jgi:long-chain fatty acid transport protein